MPETTNEDLKEAFDAHAREDKNFQDNTRQFNGEMVIFKAETEGSLASIHTKLEDVPTKEDVAIIVEEVITKLLLRKGKFAYTVVIGAGAVSVALIAIFGGLKTLLVWIGFSYLK